MSEFDTPGTLDGQAWGSIVWLRTLDRQLIFHEA